MKDLAKAKYKWQRNLWKMQNQAGSIMDAVKASFEPGWWKRPDHQLQDMVTEATRAAPYTMAHILLASLITNAVLLYLVLRAY